MAVISYKCPNCDGELVFDPATQNYKCAYCGSVYTQAQLQAVQGEEQEETQEEQEAFQTEFQSTGGMLYSCPSCGAEIVTDETTAATFCFYCHNPVVLSGRLDGAYLPDRIIPFKIDKKRAKEEFFASVRKKKFIPGHFFDDEQVEKLSGVYFPYWICDCKKQIHYTANGKTLRIWRVGDVEYTETKQFRIERAGTAEFHNLTREALKKADRVLVEGVQPFRYEELTAFQMSYLAGFQAEKRDMEPKEFQTQLDQETDRYAENLVKQTVSHYNAVTGEQMNTKLTEENWVYALVPVWLLTYRESGKDKLYYFAMNGQTGKIVGDFPISYQKLLACSGAVALIVFLLFLVGGYML